MESSNPPGEANLHPGEELIGDWSIELPLSDRFVATVDSRFILTDQRLIVLSRPHARKRGKLSRLLTGRGKELNADMGRWHLLLNSPLQILPRPTVGFVGLAGPTSLPNNRALIVGTDHYWLGDAPFAEELLSRILEQQGAPRESALS